MSSFDLPPGFPNAVVDEYAVDLLLAENRKQFAMRGSDPFVRLTGVMLKLRDETEADFTPQSLANGLATLERLRTGVAEEDIYAYRYPDQESVELYWELPNPPIYPRKLFISEWHVYDGDGQLAFVNAQATTSRPLRHSELTEQRQAQEYDQRQKSLRARAGRFIGAIIAGTSTPMRLVPGTRFSVRDMPTMRIKPRREPRKRQ